MFRTAVSWILLSFLPLCLANATASSLTPVDYKYVVVGAGPGGLQMAQFLQLKGRSYIVVEAKTIASAFVKYPIHRQLISINKIYAGEGEGHEFSMRHDWNSLLYTTKDLDAVPAPPFTFRNYTSEYLPHADYLVQYLRDFAQHYKLNIRQHTKVVDLLRDVLSKEDEQQHQQQHQHQHQQRMFTVVLRHANGTKYQLRCEKVIWATGLKPNIHADEVYDELNRYIEYSELDIHNLQMFANKSIRILGKGNAAMEVATSLMPYASTIDMISSGPVKRAVDTHYTGDVRVMNSNPIGGYQLKSLVSLLDNEYEGEGGRQLSEDIKFSIKRERRHKNKNSNKLEPAKYIRTYTQFKNDSHEQSDVYQEYDSADYLIGCTGFDGANDILQPDGGRLWKYAHLNIFKYKNITFRRKPSQGLQRVELLSFSKFPEMKPWYESSTIDGLYFAGAQMHGRDYKRGNNGFIHGFRYSVRALHHWIEQEVEQIFWPAIWGSDEPWELTRRIHDRIRTSSGLYQMFGVMCDVFIFSEGGHTSNQRFREPVGTAHIREIPCDAVPDIIERHWRFQDTTVPESAINATGGTNDTDATRHRRSRVRFFTLVLDYARCYKGEAVVVGTRPCAMNNRGCYSQSNFLHPIIRYYDSPSNEDLTQRTAKHFEHYPTREFHLAEDLSTKWNAKNVFWSATITFFERIDMLRRGMSKESAPILIMERDTTIPLANCEFDKMGQYLLNKAKNHYMALQKIKSNKSLLEKQIAIDVLMGKETLSGKRKKEEMQAEKELYHATRHEFFLAQAFKMKPALWINIFRGVQLDNELGEASMDYNPTEMSEEVRSILRNHQGENPDDDPPDNDSNQPNMQAPDEQQGSDQQSNPLSHQSWKDGLFMTAKALFDASLNRHRLAKNTATSCASPTMSVEGCLAKWMNSKDIPSHGVSNMKDTWFQDSVIAPNSTNNLNPGYIGGARSPCFARRNCASCHSDHCSWCYGNSKCLSNAYEKCDLVDSAMAKCSSWDEQDKKGQASRGMGGWRFTHPNKLLSEMAVITRLEFHPSNHSESIQSKVLEMNSMRNNDSTSIDIDYALNNECHIKGGQSCSSCLANKCAWCRATNQCVLDLKGQCPGKRGDHIGLLVDNFMCPEALPFFTQIKSRLGPMDLHNMQIVTQMTEHLNMTQKNAERYVGYYINTEQEKRTRRRNTRKETNVDRKETNVDTVDYSEKVKPQLQQQVRQQQQQQHEVPPTDVAKHFDYVVVGAGPGGLQMARFLQEKNRSYIVVEMNSSAAATFKTYPKHRKLISTNKMYAGNTGREFHMRHDWNSLLHTVKDLDDAPPAPVKFQNYSTDYFPNADALVDYLNDFEKHYKLNVQYNSEVIALYQHHDEESVEEEDDDDKEGGESEKGFRPLFFVKIKNSVEANKFSWIRCNRIIWATGLMPHHLFDKFEGPPGTILKYEDLDVGQLSMFANKKIVIVGKGNTAMEIADSLLPYHANLDILSRSPPKRAVQTHYTGDIREMNEGAIGGYQLKSLISMVDGLEFDVPPQPDGVESFVKSEFNGPFSNEVRACAYYRNLTDNKVTRQSFGRIVGDPNIIVYATGFDSNLTVLTKSRLHPDFNNFNNNNATLQFEYPHLTQIFLPTKLKNSRGQGDKFPDMKPWYESTHVKGLYFAGAQMHGRDYKIGNNGFIHGFRYSVRVLHRWLEQEVEHEPWPVKWSGDEPWELTSLVHERIVTSSGLYQMFGVMCDLVVFSEGGYTSNNRYRQPVGVAHVQEIPCDMIADVIERNWRFKTKSGEKTRVRFFTLRLEYHRCYKNAAVFQPARACDLGNIGCHSQSNFLHPVIRYYDSPKNEDLRLKSTKEMESTAPTRELHLVEDLSTKWTEKYPELITMVFFERLWMERQGMGRKLAPLLLSERDTSLPQPDCEMEEIGELYLSKASTIFRKMIRLFDEGFKSVEMEDEMTSYLKIYEYFVAQALKFKPNLWRKYYSGSRFYAEDEDEEELEKQQSNEQQHQELKKKRKSERRERALREHQQQNINYDGSFNDLEQHDEEEDDDMNPEDRKPTLPTPRKLYYSSTQQILASINIKRRLQKLKLHKALRAEIHASPSVCTTPGFSVEGCLQKRNRVLHDVPTPVPKALKSKLHEGGVRSGSVSDSENNAMALHKSHSGSKTSSKSSFSNPLKWLETQVLVPNITNSWAQSLNPCFVFDDCEPCTKAKGCSWCPANEFCVRESLCPINENPLMQEVNNENKCYEAKQYLAMVKKETEQCHTQSAEDNTKYLSNCQLTPTLVKQGILKYRNHQLQRNMAFEARLFNHPSNHNQSLLTKSVYQDAFKRSALWQRVVKQGEMVTKAEKNRLREEYM